MTNVNETGPLPWRLSQVCEEERHSLKTEWKVWLRDTALPRAEFPWASLVARMVKNLPTMWETWVQFLGWEDLLEKGKATHCSILAWRIPWAEEPGRLQSMGLQRAGHD